MKGAVSDRSPCWDALRKFTCALASKPLVCCGFGSSHRPFYFIPFGYAHSEVPLLLSAWGHCPFYVPAFAAFCLFASISDKDEDRVTVLGGQWIGFVVYSKYFLNGPNLVVSLAIYIKRFLFGRNTG